MEIRWENYVWKEPRPVVLSDIERLESMWGVELPGDYKKVLAAHQGNTPEPCVFNVGKGANVFSVLLTVARHMDRASYSIQDSSALMFPRESTRSGRRQAESIYVLTTRGSPISHESFW